MGFLTIYYAGAYFFIALCGYVCISVVAGLNALGKQVFVAILAFGACSYIGFIVILLAVSALHFDAVLAEPFRTATFTLAYIIPGQTGVWASLKALKALRWFRPQD
jgi:hypothetical protein